MFGSLGFVVTLQFALRRRVVVACLVRAPVPGERETKELCFARSLVVVAASLRKVDLHWESLIEILRQPRAAAPTSSNWSHIRSFVHFCFCDVGGPEVLALSAVVVAAQLRKVGLP